VASIKKNSRPDSVGFPKPDVQLDSSSVYVERKREGYVMGEADKEYGMVSGFRFGLESTGMRHKMSPLGKRVRETRPE
jgi:hypothetical protein